MKAVIRLTADLGSFDKSVELTTLPDIGDAVRVRPYESDTIYNGVVTARTFEESGCELGYLTPIIHVKAS